MVRSTSWRVSSAEAISIPIRRPIPRTATIRGSAIRRNRARMAAPICVARCGRASASITSNAARPAAQDSGWPPKVVMWPSGGSCASTESTELEPQNAPSGKPPPSALARTMMSGVTPKCSSAKSLPVRPKPVSTSSKMSRAPV